MSDDEAATARLSTRSDDGMSEYWEQIEVRFYVSVPEKSSEEQVREWVTFNLHRGGIQTANKLSNHDLEAAGHISIRRLA